MYFVMEDPMYSNTTKKVEETTKKQQNWKITVKERAKCETFNSGLSGKWKILDIIFEYFKIRQGYPYFIYYINWYKYMKGKYIVLNTSGKIQKKKKTVLHTKINMKHLSSVG